MNIKNSQISLNMFIKKMSVNLQIGIFKAPQSIQNCNGQKLLDVERFLLKVAKNPQNSTRKTMQKSQISGIPQFIVKKWAEIKSK